MGAAALPKVLLPNNMTVREDSPGIAKIAYSQVVDYFEHPDGGFPASRFRDGMVVFDAGMNLGLFSLECLRRAKEKGMACTVFGFEPIPATYACAKANLTDNGFIGDGATKQRSVPINAGCGETAGRVTFTHLPGWSMRSSCVDGGMVDLNDHHWTNIDFMLKAANGTNTAELPDGYMDIIPWYGRRLPERLARAVHWAWSGGGNARVTETQLVDAELVTLSSIISEHKVAKIDLLKVDVEKAEMLVLKGLSDADWKMVQAVVAEVHDDDGKLDAIKAMCAKAGLDKVDVVQEAAFKGTNVFTLIACRSDPSEKKGLALELLHA